MNAKQELLNKIGDTKIKCANILKGEDDHIEIILKLNYSEEEYLNFLNELDFNYCSDYGYQEVYGTVWLEDGTWLSRSTDDMYEWWSHIIRTPPFDIPDICLKGKHKLIDLTAYKIKSFELNLKREGTLSHYAKTILNHYVNVENPDEHYISSWIDSDKLYTRWLIFKVTVEDLIYFIEKNLTLLHLIQKNQSVYFLDFDEDFNEVNVFLCPIQKIPDDYLPLETSFFKESSYAPYSLILKDKLLNHN